MSVRNSDDANKKQQEAEIYLIIFESIRQILDSFVTDLISTEVEFGKCLCEWVGDDVTKETKKDWHLRCYFREPLPDVVLLRHRYYCQRGSV